VAFEGKASTRITDNMPPPPETSPETPPPPNSKFNPNPGGFWAGRGSLLGGFWTPFHARPKEVAVSTLYASGVTPEFFENYMHVK